MRYIIFVFICILFACNHNNSEEAEYKEIDSINGPVLYVQKQLVDLGKIMQGDRVKCVFDIENHGKSDLLIKSVSAGCGCTSTDWDPAPIKPGEKSKIEIEFNSSGKSGKQTKKVFVNSNAHKQDAVLTFTCEVEIPNKTE